MILSLSLTNHRTPHIRSPTYERIWVPLPNRPLSQRSESLQSPQHLRHPTRMHIMRKPLTYPKSLQAPLTQPSILLETPFTSDLTSVPSARKNVFGTLRKSGRNTKRYSWNRFSRVCRDQIGSKFLVLPESPMVSERTGNPNEDISSSKYRRLWTSLGSGVRKRKD